MKEIDRRAFLKGTAWMGAVAIAMDCFGNPAKLTAPVGAPMQGFALKPMKKVRVACVGVGSRGAGAVHRIAMIPGTEVVAIADLFQDRIDRQLKWLQDNRKPAPRKTFAGPESWKRVCGIARAAGFSEMLSHRALTADRSVQETRFANGMVVTVEPGLYYPDLGGVRIEDTVVVTETGCRVL